MVSNSLFVIKPYKWNGMWVFDDPEVGLVNEPFVSGIPSIIETANADIPEAETGFIGIFSSRPFPGYDVELKLLREEYGGNCTVGQNQIRRVGCVLHYLNITKLPQNALYKGRTLTINIELYYDLKE